MTCTVKKATIAMLFFNISTCFAGIIGSTDTLPSYDGFYAGANLGVSNFLNKEQTQVTAESHQLGSLGFIGGGFVGYDYYLSEHINIDIEGFGNASGLNNTINHGSVDTAYQTTSHYNAGLRLLPGYQFSPGLQGHFIVGYANAHFQVRDSGNYGYINSAFNKNGFQGGLGCTTQLMQFLLLRLDAMYTTYGSKTSVGTGLASSGVATQTYTNSFNTFEGDLSLIYKF